MSTVGPDGIVYDDAGNPIGDTGMFAQEQPPPPANDGPVNPLPPAPAPKSAQVFTSGQQNDAFINNKLSNVKSGKVYSYGAEPGTVRNAVSDGAVRPGGYTGAAVSGYARIPGHRDMNVVGEPETLKELANQNKKVEADALNAGVAEAEHTDAVAQLQLDKARAEDAINNEILSRQQQRANIEHDYMRQYNEAASAVPKTFSGNSYWQNPFSFLSVIGSSLMAMAGKPELGVKMIEDQIAHEYEAQKEDAEAKRAVAGRAQNALQMYRMIMKDEYGADLAWEQNARQNAANKLVAMANRTGIPRIIQQAEAQANALRKGNILQDLQMQHAAYIPEQYLKVAAAGVAGAGGGGKGKTQSPTDEPGHQVSFDGQIYTAPESIHKEAVGNIAIANTAIRESDELESKVKRMIDFLHENSPGKLVAINYAGLAPIFGNTKTMADFESLANDLFESARVMTSYGSKNEGQGVITGGTAKVDEIGRDANEAASRVRGVVNSVRPEKGNLASMVNFAQAMNRALPMIQHARNRFHDAADEYIKAAGLKAVDRVAKKDAHGNPVLTEEYNMDYRTTKKRKDEEVKELGEGK